VEVQPQEYLLIGFSLDTFQGCKESEKQHRVTPPKRIIQTLIVFERPGKLGLTHEP
jgi:hypothetical protein